MVTVRGDRGAAAVTNQARRPACRWQGRGKGGSAAVMVTNESNLVDLFVTIFRFFWPKSKAAGFGAANT